jgi:hypothetical protein
MSPERPYVLTLTDWKYTLGPHPTPTLSIDGHRRGVVVELIRSHSSLHQWKASSRKASRIGGVHGLLSGGQQLLERLHEIAHTLVQVFSRKKRFKKKEYIP